MKATILEWPDIIEDMIGWPFRLGGRDAAGIDCIGTILHAYSQRGILLVDPTSVTNEGVLEAPIMDRFRELGEGERPYDGDVARYNRTGMIFDHVGLFYEWKILHTTKRIGLALIGVDRMKPSAYYRFTT